MGMKHLLLPVPREAGTGDAQGGPGDAAAVQHQLGAWELPSCTLSSGPVATQTAFANVVPGADGGEMEEKVLGNQARPILNTCPCETVN